MREKNVMDMANRKSEKDKKIKYVKTLATVMYITIIFCAMLAALEPVYALSVKAVIKLGGLIPVVNGTLNVIISVDHASTRQVIEIEKGKEIRAEANIEGQYIRKNSNIIIEGIINSSSNVLKIKLTFHESGWRVTEAEYNSAFLKPIPNVELLNVQLVTNIAKVEVFIPNFLITEEYVEVKIGEESISPSITSSSSGTYIVFNAFININETTTMTLNIIRSDKKLLSISGTIPIEGNNYTGVKVEGVFDNVNLKFLRGLGLIEFSISTEILKELPINDRGVIFRGIEVTIKPLSSIEAAREVRILVFDEYTKKIIQKPVHLSIFMEDRKSWLNVTATYGNASIKLPKEPLRIYASVEGYEDSSTKVDPEVSLVSLYLRNKSPSVEERIVRLFYGLQQWILKNLLAFLLVMVIIAFALIVIWRRR
jgi:hypothetical protein